MLAGPSEERLRFMGSGFVVADGRVLTAYHVVRGHPVQELVIETPGGDLLPVQAVGSAEHLDAAVLNVEGARGAPIRVGSRAGVAGVSVGAEWIVTMRPLDNDPQLSGTVAATGRQIVNNGGHPVPVLQLKVAEILDDYQGYSGSAVRLDSRRDVVIGLLCEQVQSRLKSPGGGKPRATNVLYAVPIGLVVHELGLSVPTVGGSAEAVFRRISRLISTGDLAAADRELSLLPAGEQDSGDFWYWRAQVATARQNLDVSVKYLDEALRRDPGHQPGIVALIRGLLLTNGIEERATARRRAEQSRGLSGELDQWLLSLDAKGMFGPGIRSGTELDGQCPPPGYEWLDGDKDR